MPNNKAINLLPQEEFGASLTGRTLKWAMGTFRIIVIVTEMVVMGAFLSRFWLDAQNSDLTTAIKIKSAQITAQTQVEQQFRSIQSKLIIAKELQAITPFSQKVNLITSNLPVGVILTGISVSQNTIQVKGTSPSELAIAQFLTNLKAEATFKDVELGEVGTSENDQNLTVFSINITY